MFTVETVQTQTLSNVPRFNISLTAEKKDHVYLHTFMDNWNLVQVTLQHQISS